MILQPQLLETIAVNMAGGSGDNTIKAAVPGRRWVLYYAAIATAGSASTVTFKETGATLTGVIAIPANTIWEIEAKGAPLMQASGTNKALIISCGAADIDGWVQVGYISQ